MAQRFWQQFSFGLEKMPVRLNAEIVMTNGAGTCTINRGKGFTSATVGATGLLTITLDDIYFRLLGLSVITKAVDGATLPVTPFAWLKSETVATTKTVVIQLTGGVNGTVATATTTNTAVFVELLLSNSTAV